jgi:hypothetical protein
MLRRLIKFKIYCSWVLKDLLEQTARDTCIFWPKDASPLSAGFPIRPYR